ncbi:MAG: hypothetical protein ACO3HV_02430, partial [Candidatus Nanopelagicales bacterium]
MRRTAAILALAVVLSALGISAPAAAPVPKPGKPCPKAGLVWEDGKGGLFKCVKKGKKLVWRKIKGGGGGGGGGGDDYTSQPVPADGKWKVPAGYPDDLPPLGWRGEPSWFVSNWDVLTAQRVGPACGE